MRVLFLSLLFLLQIQKVSASDKGLRILVEKLNKATQKKICELVLSWAGRKNGLVDKAGLWTGKNHCGETSAVCQEYFKGRGITSRRVIVENLNEFYNHSFLVVPIKKETYIVDPTVRQYGLEPGGDSFFLIKNVKSIKTWLDSQEKEIINPYWLCYEPGEYEISSYGAYKCFLPHQSMLSDMLKEDLDEKNPRYADFLLFKKQFLEDLKGGEL